MDDKEKRYTWEGMIRKHFPEKAIPRYEKTKFAGVFKYVGKTGVSYGVDYYANGNKHREVVGPSMAEAKEKLEEIHTQVRKGDFVVNRKKFTFAELLKRFEEIKEGSGSSYFENTQKYYLPILANFFGTMKLYQISPYDIEKFKKMRMETPKRYGGTRSQTTVNRELACLQGLFSKAVTWGMMERNVFDRFRESIFFPENASRVRYLQESEIKTLLAVSPPYLKNIIKAALLTGLRKGDALSLKWEDVDLEKGLLFFNEQKKRGRRVTKVLNSDMIDLLMSIRKGKSGYIFNAPVPRKKGEKEYIAYPDPNGKSLKDVARSFGTALKKAGISNFRFHDLRHTSASYMVMRGASLQATQQHLGHSNVSMTMKYSHLSPAYLKEEISRLNGLCGEGTIGKELVRNEGMGKNEMQPTIEGTA